MKKTIRLGSFLLAFLLLVCTLPVTAWRGCAKFSGRLRWRWLM